MLGKHLIFIGALLNVAVAKPAPMADQYARGVDWLSRYGYLPPPNSRALRAQEGIQRALRAMQRFAGLEETGQLDNATLTLMATPRCSLPDIIGTEDLLRRRKKKRRRRYALSGLQWTKTDITWSLDSSPSLSQSPSLMPELVELILTYAFRVWGDATPLSFHLFRPSRHGPAKEADIRVSFTRGYHDDGYPFDGSGGTLAHAFFPGTGDLGGDTHFDDDESWKYGDDSGGVDLFTVAVHEFGHALGLSHSSSDHSIMRPFYQGSVGDIQSYTLPADDRLGIQELYGKREHEVPPPPEAPPNEPQLPSPTPPKATNRPSPSPDRCQGGFDAIARIRGEVFFFKNSFFWRMQHMGSLVSFSPARIQSFWIGLPPDFDQIDAVYERTDGYIVFFIGNRYWLFEGRTSLPGYPRPLADWELRNHAGQAPERVGAIFVWPHNGKTYLFSDSEFWRFHESNGVRKLERGYPKPASLWTGVPSDPDDIITWEDGDTYFFKDTSYWILRKGGLNQEIVTQKSIAVDWMKCDTSTQTDLPEGSNPRNRECCCDKSTAVIFQTNFSLFPLSVSTILFYSIMF